MNRQRYHFGTRTRIFLALSIFLMVIIFVFSHQSGEASAAMSNAIAKFLGIEKPSGEGDSGAPVFLNLSLRNMAHVCIYTALGCTTVLFYLSLLERETVWDYVRAGMLSLFTCVSYAATDELHQYFIPDRSCRLWDVALDAMGALMGILTTVVIWYLIAVRRNMKSKT